MKVFSLKIRMIGLAGILVFSLMFASGFIYFVAYPQLRISYLEYKAEGVIKKIEIYKTKNGRLPTSLSELDKADYDWLRYEQAGSNYTLTFFTGAYWYTNSYDSKSGDWIEYD